MRESEQSATWHFDNQRIDGMICVFGIQVNIENMLFYSL